MTDSTGTAYGGAAVNTANFTIDTNTPSISAIATSAFSWGDYLNATEDNNDGTVSITTSGVENDQTLTITLNGQTYTNTVTDNATTVTITAGGLQGLAEGSVTMTADVSDAAGNAVDQVTSSAFTYDVTAPTVSSAAMSDSALKSGETATLTITFSEAVTAFANADLTIPNGSLTAVSSADGGTTWTATYTPDADVEDTSNVISIATSYTDLAGNAGAAGQTANFEIDTNTPSISAIATSAFSWGDYLNATEDNNDGTVSITTSGVENDQTVTITLNGQTYTNTVTDNATTVTITAGGLQGLAEGSVTMTADVSDAAGNAADQVTSSAFTYDKTAPTVSSAAMSDSALKSGETATLTITFSEAVTAFANADLTIPNGSLTAVSSADGGTTWTATYTPDADVEDTSNVISIATSYTDLAGNAGAAGQTANFEIDTLLPTLTSVGIASNNATSTLAAAGDVVTLTITASETIGTPTVTFFSGGDAINDGTIDYLNTGGNTWTAKYTANSSDTDGSVTFSITFSDTSGNAGVAVTAVTDGSSVTC